MEDCLHCSSTPPSYHGAAVWGEYDGVLKTVVLTLKHGRRDELAAPLGRLMAARIALEEWAAEIDHVTFVPSHGLRRMRHGWSAARSLAAGVAAALDRGVRTNLKRRGLRRQTGRSRATRLGLSATAFGPTTDVRHRTILLVDDVTTTGATLDRASDVLLAAGADAVFCAAAARTPDPRRMT
jgi:predicted amidophosphoribosyltransferase